MSAQILLDDQFPHGTAGGFLDGCHGSRCPAVISCKVVHSRYAGDFAFRRMVDQGVPLEVIVAVEQKAAQDALQAAKDARKRRPGARAKAKAGDRRAAANRARAYRSMVIPRDTLRAFLDEGLTDRQIAERVGLTRPQITGARNNAGWERNPDQKGNRAPSIDVLLPTVAHLNNADAAKQLGRTVSYVRRRRNIFASTPNQPPAMSGVSSSQGDT